jgi:hypothetical protein
MESKAESLVTSARAMGWFRQRINQLMLESLERQTLTMSETAKRSNGFKSSPLR